jgi:hypothetical protein
MLKKSINSAIINKVCRYIRRLCGASDDGSFSAHPPPLLFIFMVQLQTSLCLNGNARKDWGAERQDMSVMHTGRQS